MVLRRRAGLARKSACKTMMGRSPYPLGDARVVRRPGIDQAIVVIRSIASISGNPPQPIMPPANEFPRFIGESALLLMSACIVF